MLQQRDAQIDTHSCLQAKYQELREQFTPLRNLYYLIECSWCKQRIRWQRKREAVPGDTSHSICASCAAAITREIAKLRLPPMVFAKLYN